MEKLGPAGSKKEGLASIFPKGETDSIFDIKNDKKLINHLKRKGFSWNEISTYFNH